MEELLHLKFDKSPGLDVIHPRKYRKCAGELAGQLVTVLQRFYRTGMLPSDWKGMWSFPSKRKGIGHFQKTTDRYNSSLLLIKLWKTSWMTTYVTSCKNKVYWPHGNLGLYRDTHESLIYLVLWRTGTKPQMSKTYILMWLPWIFRERSTTWNTRSCCEKLLNMGSTGSSNKWLEWYLAKRTYQVRVNGSTFSPLLATSGSPHGSILDPLLFL